MVTIVKSKVSLEEYLTYHDGLDTRYELVNGDLIPISLGSGEHGEIADMLCDQFKAANKRLGLSWVAKVILIGVQSPRGSRWDTSRIPDIVVIPAAQWRTLQNREAVIRLNEPAPLLVVEVVSESTKAEDYYAKRLEYRALGIPEYWIVDPLAQKITICILAPEAYQSTEYKGIEVIQSFTFPALTLTTAEILQPQIGKHM
jgi:Uma2 family endonuclease